MSVSLSSQLLTVALLTLQRQLRHNQVLVNSFNFANSSLAIEVDYIIVGGGTAGSIVAGRLSEDANVSVLLFEAGGPIPVLREMTGVIDLADEVWPYTTVRQRSSSFAFNSGRAALPYGKVLGGSHLQTLNVYTRGNRRDYDRFSEHYGARGWSYQEVLPYFRMSENNTDPMIALNSRVHGTNGPVEVSTIPNPDPFETRWRSIAHEAGWPIADYGDSENQYGFSIPQVTQSASNWTRRTTASAYVEDNAGRPNLHVQLYSHVTRVLFTGRRASGVEFISLKNNQTYRVHARREVILSAGSINSAALLMLSGIGPRNHLGDLGISLLADLPVGSRMYSHASVPMDFELKNVSDITLQRNIDNAGLTVTNLYDFLVHSDGPLRQRPVAMMYIATDINGDRDWADGYLVCTSGAVFTEDSLEAALLNYLPEKQSEWRKYLEQYLNNERHIYNTFLNYRPLSTGTLRLASRNPLDAPLIDPAFFSNRQDLAAHVRAMSIGFRLFESSAAQALFTYSSLPVPGCSFCSDGRPLSRCYSYFACVAQSVTASDWHDCATVPMGNGSDSVLDERLRVRSVQGLRVVDASVLPNIPNANTLAAAMMVGEKGASLIRSDWGLN